MRLRGPSIREQMIQQGAIRAEPTNFDSWLNDGVKNEEGVIDFYRRVGGFGFGYIQPYRFPYLRLHFTDGDVKHDRHRIVRGLHVRFNVDPQLPSEDQSPTASTVRLLLPKGKE